MNTNILVTSYATQASPSQLWGGDPTSLDLTSYEEMLKMLKTSGEKHFNLIGGEPTVHPNLTPILERTNEWCKENRATATLVTNGTYLEQYITSLGSFINIILTFADLHDFTKIEHYTDIVSVMQHMDNLGWFESEKTVCRFELQQSTFSFEYIENLFETFKLPQVEVNFAPISLGGNPEEYFTNLKKQFLNFCNIAYHYHVKVKVNSYNAIPYCYFNATEKAQIQLVCENYPKYSEAFRLVILPNMECIYDRYNNLNEAIKANLTDFSTLQELNKYLLLAIYYPLTIQKGESRCMTCPAANLYKCDGRYLFRPDAKIKEDEFNE